MKVINSLGYIRHIPWADVYNQLKEKVGIHPPGYIIHESAYWSKIHNKWFFLPRRASKERLVDNIEILIQGASMCKFSYCILWYITVILLYIIEYCRYITVILLYIIEYYKYITDVIVMT